MAPAALAIAELQPEIETLQGLETMACQVWQRDTGRRWEELATTSPLFGRDGHMVTIHGSVPGVERRAIKDRFRNDPDVYFLLATDAAGEGVNLQRAHLMINYDLPWNPGRLERRFGRIHRIGQTEVCHLWNLVAGRTREGYVYARLLRKLEMEGKALERKVFDIWAMKGYSVGHPCASCSSGRSAMGINRRFGPS